MSEGVFETLRVREGRLPFLGQHLSRLEGAARRLGLAVPRDLPDALRRSAAEPELVVRATLDASGARVESRPVPAAGAMRCRVVTGTHEPYPFKFTAREPFDRAGDAARAAGDDEALLLTADGFLAEGSMTSVAFFDEGRLRLPALDIGILPGVGRARLLAVARSLGIPVDEGRWPRSSFEGQPLVLVNAVRGVIDVVALDGAPRVSEPLTVQLAARFWPWPDSTPRGRAQPPGHGRSRHFIA